MINIAQRLTPFSHVPGTRCLIPGTALYVEVFPALVRIFTLEGTLVKEIPFDVTGPLKEFTVMQNLERGCVTVWSKSYHYHILPPAGELLFCKNPGLSPIAPQERLHLGCHKKQEWDGIKKRGEMREIFPFWFRLGSFYGRISQQDENFSLLQECRQQIEANAPEHIVSAFEKLFLAGFKHLMIPRLQDDDFQGILKNTLSHQACSPLSFLSEGAALMRSLFVASAENMITILPHLPPEFFSGRMTNIQCLPCGTLDLEWTKKMIRCLHFRSLKDGEVLFHFRPIVKSYRVRTCRQDRGKRCANGEPLEIKSGALYLLDQFQK